MNYVIPAVYYNEGLNEYKFYVGRTKVHFKNGLYQTNDVFTNWHHGNFTKEQLWDYFKNSVQRRLEKEKYRWRKL